MDFTSLRHLSEAQDAIKNSTITGCLTSNDCFQGICDLSRGTPGQCKCWVGWLGPTCDENLSDLLPNLFFFWRLTMIFLNLILFFVSTREVLKSRTKMAVLKSVTIKYKKTRDMTAKKVILFLIFIMSIFKLVWLIVDPYLFQGKLPRILERLLSELTFSLIYSVYATILYIWYSLTERIFKRNNEDHDHEDTSVINQVVQNYLQDNNKSNIFEKKQFPKIILYFKHLGLPKAVIFYSVQVFSSSLKNYKRSSYLVLLSIATIIELAIMILLIIEFLLMSRFLNNILSEEQKKMTAIKNNLTKNVQIITDLEGENEVQKLEEILPLEMGEYSPIVPSQMILVNNSPGKKLNMNKGIATVRKNFKKLQHLGPKLKNFDIAEEAKNEFGPSNEILNFKREKVLLDFEKSSQKVPFNIENLDFGAKSDFRKKKRNLESMLKEVRIKKRQGFIKELKNSKNKEKTFQKIANETMVMHSERKMLLKGGDTNRFSQRSTYNAMNDVYKDEKMVFNRILKMMYTVITLLFLYALTFIFVYLLNTTYYDAWLTMIGIFIMEASQMLSGLSFYFILRGVKSTFSRNLKAIYILNSAPTSQKKFSLNVDGKYKNWKNNNLLADLNI